MTKFKTVDEFMAYSIATVEKFQQLCTVRGKAVDMEDTVRKEVPEARLCLSVTYLPYGIDVVARTVYLSVDTVSNYVFAHGRDELPYETLADYELLVDYKDDDMLGDIVMSTLDDIQELLFVNLALRAKMEHEDVVLMIYVDNSNSLELGTGDEEIDAFVDYITNTD